MLEKYKDAVANYIPYAMVWRVKRVDFLPQSMLSNTTQFINYPQVLSVGTVEKISLLISHQLFSLAHDWWKRVTWLHTSQLKLENDREIVPSFQSGACTRSSKLRKLFNSWSRSCLMTNFVPNKDYCYCYYYSQKKGVWIQITLLFFHYGSFYSYFFVFF